MTVKMILWECILHILESRFSNHKENLYKSAFSIHVRRVPTVSYSHAHTPLAHVLISSRLGSGRSLFCVYNFDSNLPLELVQYAYLKFPILTS